jgi:polyribonucleotide nucleotidyltransferase
MATVCASSLALMDSGVPIPAHVAGIAMGLIKEGDEFVVLSDIQGDEDHLGDMDFKVAGTKKGITALQMDIKITSITFEIMEQALHQALIGRNHIEEQMVKALQEARPELSSTAPQIMTLVIDKDKIRELIGPGGKVIREICESTGAKIDITDSGVVSVFGIDNGSLSKAMAMIDDIAGEPEVGQIYSGPVVKIMEFGAFINFFGKRDGLLHISEISEERVENVEDVLKLGDVVKVILLGIDERTRRFRLSMKAIGDKNALKPRQRSHSSSSSPSSSHSSPEGRYNGNKGHNSRRTSFDNNKSHRPSKFDNEGENGSGGKKKGGGGFFSKRKKF